MTDIDRFISNLRGDIPDDIIRQLRADLESLHCAPPNVRAVMGDLYPLGIQLCKLIANVGGCGVPDDDGDLWAWIRMLEDMGIGSDVVRKLHKLRKLANQAKHGTDTQQWDQRQAVGALHDCLDILEWFYLEWEKGPGWESIYTQTLESFTHRHDGPVVPFPLPALPRHLVGRDDLTLALLAAITKRSGSVTVVKGPAGFGKTTLLAGALGQALEKNLAEGIIYISCRDDDGADCFGRLEQGIVALNGAVEVPKDADDREKNEAARAKLLVRELHLQGNVWVVLDNLESLLDSGGRIRKDRIGTGEFLRASIASRHSFHVVATSRTGLYVEGREDITEFPLASGFSETEALACLRQFETSLDIPQSSDADLLAGARGVGCVPNALRTLAGLSADLGVSIADVCADPKLAEVFALRDTSDERGQRHLLLEQFYQQGEKQQFVLCALAVLGGSAEETLLGRMVALGKDQAASYEDLSVIPSLTRNLVLSKEGTVVSMHPLWQQTLYSEIPSGQPVVDVAEPTDVSPLSLLPSVLKRFPLCTWHTWAANAYASPCRVPLCDCSDTDVEPYFAEIDHLDKAGLKDVVILRVLDLQNEIADWHPQVRERLAASFGLVPPLLRALWCANRVIAEPLSLCMEGGHADDDFWLAEMTKALLDFAGISDRAITEIPGALYEDMATVEEALRALPTEPSFRWEDLFIRPWLAWASFHANASYGRANLLGLAECLWRFVTGLPWLECIGNIAYALTDLGALEDAGRLYEEMLEDLEDESLSYYISVALNERIWLLKRLEDTPRLLRFAEDLKQREKDSGADDEVHYAVAVGVAGVWLEWGRRIRKLSATADGAALSELQDILAFYAAGGVDSGFSQTVKTAVDRGDSGLAVLVALVNAQMCAADATQWVDPSKERKDHEVRSLLQGIRNEFVASDYEPLACLCRENLAELKASVYPPSEETES